MRRSRTCTFELDPRGFVRAVIDELADMTLDDAREALAITAEVAGKKRPVLVDSRRVRSQTRDARLEFGSERAAEICTAVAVLVGSPVSRIIANFFIDRTEQRCPTRLFTDEAQAIAWLSKYPG